MIKHSDKTMAYQKAYPKCTDAESARKSAERLLRHHPDVAAEIEEATAQIRHQAYTEAYRLYTEQQKTKLLSILDKREILARIAKCEIKVCRYIKDGDRYRMLFEDPHPREIMKAIEADGRIEDRCNRARNLADPKLSQFNVYIDGRPCDDPTAPINPDLPPGLVMLPRTRKKLNTEQGNNLEQNHKTPLLFLGGENGEAPVGVSHSAEVDSCSTLAQEESPISESANKTEQNSKLPLPDCPDHFGRGVGVCTLAHEKISITEHGNNLEQNQEKDSFPVLRELRSNHDTNIKDVNNVVTSGTNEVSDGRVDTRSTLPPYNSPLYPQYLALYRKRKLWAEDLMCDSFYSKNKAAEAAAPPPRILTDEEVRELIAEADRKQENQEQPPKPQYNTFGKMYFPPEGQIKQGVK